MYWVDELLVRVHSKEELMGDSKWFLLFAGALTLQAAIFHILLTSSWEPALPFAGAAVLWIVCALIPLFWLRFAAVLVCTALLAVDIFLRQNPVSVFFMLFGLWHVVQMFRRGLWKEQKAA